MCGRYYIEDEDEAALLEAWLGKLNRGAATGQSRRREVRPADFAVTIANNRDLQPSVFTMQWGYTMENGKKLINARSETAAQKGIFADGMRQRRCLIPASGYYEWRRLGRERQQYAIRPTATEALYFAAVYRFESMKPVFSILTRQAAPRISAIHPRMPVMLVGQNARNWLNLRVAPEQILYDAETDVHAQIIAGTEPMFELDVPEAEGLSFIREE